MANYFYAWNLFYSFFPKKRHFVFHVLCVVFPGVPLFYTNRKSMSDQRGTRTLCCRCTAWWDTAGKSSRNPKCKKRHEESLQEVMNERGNRKLFHSNQRKQKERGIKMHKVLVWISHRCLSVTFKLLMWPIFLNPASLHAMNSLSSDSCLLLIQNVYKSSLAFTCVIKWSYLWMRRIVCSDFTFQLFSSVSKYKSLCLETSTSKFCSFWVYSVMWE